MFFISPHYLILFLVSIYLFSFYAAKTL